MSIIGKFYKVKEAADLLNISEETLWRWIRFGKVRAIRLPSGRYRIPESEITKVLGWEAGPPA